MDFFQKITIKNADKLPYYLQMASIIYFISTTTIAMFLYDNYRFYEQYLSALGVGPTGIFFNPGLMFIGVSSFWFNWRLYNLLIQKGAKIILARFLFGFGILSGILMIAIGVFISDGPSSDIHDIVAISFFIIGIPFYLIFPSAIEVLYPENSSLISFKTGGSLLSYSVSMSTLIGLFFQSMVNLHVFQKLIVFLELLFIFVLAYNLSFTPGFGNSTS